MTLKSALADVPVLVPAKVREARKSAKQALKADLAAIIDTLPSDARRDAEAPMEPEQFRTWAQAVIRALPTHQEA